MEFRPRLLLGLAISLGLLVPLGLNKFRGNTDHDHIHDGDPIRGSDRAHGEDVYQNGQETTKISAFIVMGKTGAGKSAFIKLIGGLDIYGREPDVDGGVASCTRRPTIYLARIGRRRIMLLDTPGFDDFARENLEILNDIVSQLYILALQPEDVEVQGVVFLHDIGETRYGGSQRKTLAILKALVGEKFWANFIVGTTMWSNRDLLKLRQQEKRELDLLSDQWGGVYKTTRIPQDDRNVAVGVIGDLFTRPPGLLLVQEEMLRPPHTVESTTAGLLAMPEGRLELENLRREQVERERVFEEESRRQEALLQAQIDDARRRFETQEEIREHETRLRGEFEREKGVRGEEAERVAKRVEEERLRLIKILETVAKLPSRKWWQRWLVDIVDLLPF